MFIQRTSTTINNDTMRDAKRKKKIALIGERDVEKK